jgi:hypothetical protein
MKNDRLFDDHLSPEILLDFPSLRFFLLARVLFERTGGLGCFRAETARRTVVDFDPDVFLAVGVAVIDLLNAFECLRLLAALLNIAFGAIYSKGLDRSSGGFTNLRRISPTRVFLINLRRDDIKAG